MKKTPHKYKCPICNGKKSYSAKHCKKCDNYIRTHKDNCLWQDKDWLYKQYFVNKLSFASIGKLAGCSSKTVDYYLKNKFGFKPRPSIIFHPELFKGKNSPCWKGGRVVDARGYIKIFHSAPHSYMSQNYVLEHILVMEKLLKRKLHKPEVVHHKNGNPSDNRPENLMVFPSNKEHKQFEQTTETFAKKLLFGELAPHLRDELNNLFNKFLSSSVNER